MPIDKMRPSDVDPASKAQDIHFNKVICCSLCGSYNRQLKRIRDADGKRVRPARYICTECA